jgi:outer membrane biogenesis lipoprotein LolB
MTEKDLLAIGLQIPIVALFYWLVGRQIENMSKKIDAQSAMFATMMQSSNAVTRETNIVLRETTNALVALKTLVEERSADDSAIRRQHGK